jgi:putative transposase
MRNQKQTRKAYPSDLSAKQFKVLAGRLVTRKRSTGRPRADLREIVDGILYVLSTGCRWRDLPHDFGVSYGTCYLYFRKWNDTGKLKQIFEFLKAEAHRRNYLHWRNAYLDASVVKSKKGGRNTVDSLRNIK